MAQATALGTSRHRGAGASLTIGNLRHAPARALCLGRHSGAHGQTRDAPRRRSGSGRRRRRGGLWLFPAFPPAVCTRCAVRFDFLRQRLLTSRRRKRLASLRTAGNTARFSRFHGGDSLDRHGSNRGHNRFGMSARRARRAITIRRTKPAVGNGRPPRLGAAPCGRHWKRMVS